MPLPPGTKWAGASDVRAGVRAKAQVRDGAGVAVLEIERVLDPHRRIVRPVDHPIVKCDRNVDPIHVPFSGASAVPSRVATRSERAGRFISRVRSILVTVHR